MVKATESFKCLECGKVVPAKRFGAHLYSCQKDDTLRIRLTDLTETRCRFLVSAPNSTEWLISPNFSSLIEDLLPAL